jgi:hypothetical protein
MGMRSACGAGPTRRLVGPGDRYGLAYQPGPKPVQLGMIRIDWNAPPPLMLVDDTPFSLSSVIQIMSPGFIW